MPLDVEQGGAHQLGGHEALVELAGLDDLVDEILRYHLAGLVILGIVLEHLGHEREVLVHLRGLLHHVAVDVGALKSLVGGAGEHAVEGMAKLVEHGFYLVEREQRGGVFGGRREAGHVVDDGAFALAAEVVAALSSLIHAPCALVARGK